MALLLLAVPCCAARLRMHMVADASVISAAGNAALALLDLALVLTWRWYRRPCRWDSGTEIAKSIDTDRMRPGQRPEPLTVSTKASQRLLGGVAEDAESLGLGGGAFGGFTACLGFIPFSTGVHPSCSLSRRSLTFRP